MSIDEKLAEDVLTLNSHQQGDILQIIKSSNVNYSHNQNGVFVNIGTIEPFVLKSIRDYVEHSINGNAYKANIETEHNNQVENSVTDIENETFVFLEHEKENVILDLLTPIQRKQLHVFYASAIGPPTRKQSQSKFSNCVKRYNKLLDKRHEKNISDVLHIEDKPPSFSLS
jgi:hypothetical protein